MSAIDLEAVIDLGRLALAFGRVDQITYHQDGTTPESDTDHTVMLAMVACAFAGRHLPDLDLGRVAQYALVHDLVEVYAGDTPTLRISAEQKAVKRERERLALERIEREFALRLPWIPDTIHRYERQGDPEARYVKALDKLLPKITHLSNGGVTLQQQAMGRDESWPHGTPFRVSSCWATWPTSRRCWSCGPSWSVRCWPPFSEAMPHDRFAQGRPGRRAWAAGAAPDLVRWALTDEAVRSA